MKRITKEKDNWGENIIYVQSCERYKYEDPETAPMRPKDIM